MGAVVTVKRDRDSIKKCDVINFPNTKLKKDGTPKQTPNNSLKGKAKEVYPFKNREDIEDIKQYYRERMNNASNKEDRQIAARDLLYFILGLNIGLRASDILKLTWGEIFNKDNTFVDGIRIVEKKTDKYKTFFLNDSAKNAITEYVNEFNPLIQPELHIFRSREGGVIEVDTACKSLKVAAKECGIKQNIGSHSLRKSYGYWQLMAHKGDVMFLTHLQNLFHHSSQLATLRYCGLEDDQNKQYYNDIEL